MGDSAAIYPSLGQGANLAIEDACQAAAVLKIFVAALHRRASRDAIASACATPQCCR